MGARSGSLRSTDPGCCPSAAARPNRWQDSSVAAGRPTVDATPSGAARTGQATSLDVGNRTGMHARRVDGFPYDDHGEYLLAWLGASDRRLDWGQGDPAPTSTPSRRPTESAHRLRRTPQGKNFDPAWSPGRAAPAFAVYHIRRAPLRRLPLRHLHRARRPFVTDAPGHPPEASSATTETPPGRPPAGRSRSFTPAPTRCKSSASAPTEAAAPPCSTHTSAAYRPGRRMARGWPSAPPAASKASPRSAAACACSSPPTPRPHRPHSPGHPTNPAGLHQHRWSLRRRARRRRAAHHQRRQRGLTKLLPHGQWLAFSGATPGSSTQPDGDTQTDIYVVALDGSNLQAITTSPYNDGSPAGPAAALTDPD